MREKTIEQKLKIAAESMGGIAPKFISPGMDGMPDPAHPSPRRAHGLYRGESPGKVLRPLQVRRKRQLESLGFRVYVIDTPEQIGGVLDAIQTP